MVIHLDTVSVGVGCPATPWGEEGETPELCKDVV